MANGGSQSAVANVTKIPIEFTGEELMGLFTMTAATVAGGTLAFSVPTTLPPIRQLRAFMTSAARARLPLSIKSILHHIYAMQHVADDPLWTEMAYPVAGRNHHDTPAQQLFCLLCYFGRLLLETQTGPPSMLPYYELLSCTLQPNYKLIVLCSALLAPIRAMLCD